MNIIFNNKKLSNWLVYLCSLFLLIFTIIISNALVEEVKEEERLKMETWSKAIELTSSETSLEVNNFLVDILQTNKHIPVLLTNDQDSVLYSLNIPSKLIRNNMDVNEFILNSTLIENHFLGGKNYLYYQNSTIISKLQYYPLIIISIVIIFGLFTYTYYQTVKRSEQNFLWAGLAKETAHQIGTPLSSLMGWTELLKLDNVDKTITDEIEIDIARLLTITDRFSNIGSIPKLINTDIVSETEKAFDYLKNRFGSNIQFKFSSEIPSQELLLNVNLYNWVIENLIKNAIDSIQSKQGIIEIKILNLSSKKVQILIQDNGSGISRKNFKTIFNPGFTTKKRGWGLGLSLVKRIIENYHGGKVSVLKSSLGKGTTFSIILKKAY